jgi:hypothetical protein
MNIIRWLVEALNPCIHQYEVTSTMVDDPDNPRHTRLVKTCFICGRTITEDHVAPASSAHVHEWVTFEKVRIVDNMSLPKDQWSVSGFKLHQHCKCGDVRSVSTRRN